ncbi:MAG: ABC transporter permease [Gammaproteobacteria bacterium]|nr:ABC transporter permease [Gammaproteobacteria bacterium]NIR81768.1 ABC transporter permease [Gammaproteobacteria bacterium]NIR88571.1 ABC transporter permease [Gammaproteobacteria bacterium]NIU02875.1 ABC transporter permease [Gammaproteobacteria bacterium]NIV50397.1 ABC transporter permease subunit [Gammaproteobacteria bacterium]
MQESLGTYTIILPVSLLLVVFFFFPLTIIFLYSFSATDDLSQFTFTVQNYLDVLGNPSKLRMFLNSIIYSTATVIASFALAFPLAYFVSKKTSRVTQAALIALLIAPLFMSMLIRMFGWRLFFLKHGLLNQMLGYFGLSSVEGLTYMGPMAIFGMVYIYFPFILFPIYVSVSNIDDEIIQAARDLGGSSWRVMRQIVLKLARPGIAIGAALVFSLSFGDTNASEILVGNNVQLVGNMEKFSFGYAQDWLVGSAESVLMMLFLLLVIVPVLKRTEIEEMLSGMAE